MNQLMIVNDETKNKLQTHNQLHQYLTFKSGKEYLGINILDVKEIIEINTITDVPMTPAYIRGVINLRGSAVPVIDLSARLGHPRAEITKRSCIVLVQLALGKEAHLLGMLVDAVDEILEITKANIMPPPDFGAEIRIDFIQAMGRVGESFIILLSIEKIFSLEELAQLKRVTQYEANESIKETDLK